jgi:hypothetical protein
LARLMAIVKLGAFAGIGYLQRHGELSDTFIIV